MKKEMSVRYAPSPSGRLHLGNLRTAWISRLWARQLGLPWVVRYEDIDGPRVVRGARETQRADLLALGLRPDLELLQSDFLPRHELLFREAARRGDVYHCICSRKEIHEELARMASAPHQTTTAIYNGRCRDSRAQISAGPATTSLAWRFRNPQSATGAQDFIVGRTSDTQFFPAYHWACAIDDFDGDHALLVRAWDLLHVIAYQREVWIWLAKVSGDPRPYPAVFHSSIVTSDDGHRLEKRTAGVTLDQLQASGISPAEILKRLGATFDSRLLTSFLPGKTWGEAETERCLGALGF